LLSKLVYREDNNPKKTAEDALRKWQRNIHPVFHTQTIRDELSQIFKTQFFDPISTALDHYHKTMKKVGEMK